MGSEEKGKGHILGEFSRSKESRRGAICWESLVWSCWVKRRAVEESQESLGEEVVLAYISTYCDHYQ